MSADLFPAKQAAESIVEAYDNWNLRGREFKKWEAFVQVAMKHSDTVARAFLATAEAQAAHWRPAKAGKP